MGNTKGDEQPRGLIRDRRQAPSRRRLIKALQPAARLFRLPAARLYRDMRLNPQQASATVRKILALVRCLTLLDTPPAWRRYGPRLKASLPTSFRTVADADRYTRVLAAALDPAHVARSNTCFARILLDVAAEAVGGVEWARRWVRRRCPDLDGRTPWAVAEDFRGAIQALHVLRIEWRRRGREQKQAARTRAFRVTVEKTRIQER
jgi:hypothetical protein